MSQPRKTIGRREFLKVALTGLGATAFVPLLPRLSWATDGFDRAACYVPWSNDTPVVGWRRKNPPYRLALSNSYIGNMWRTQMIQLAKAFVQQPGIKEYVREFQVASSGNDVAAQIGQMNQMILSGVDAIILNAASPTALNSVVDQAIAAGILVVSFDNTVTTPRAFTVNQDQYDMGRLWAEWLVEQLNGQGNVLMVRGVSGTTVDTERTQGGKDVFSRYPGIHILDEVYGNWDDGTTQRVVANALAAYPQIDGVWCQGGDTGLVRAFLQAGRRIPPIAGEAENGFRKLAAEHKFPILSIGQSPGLVAVAIRVAIDLLQGMQVPRDIKVPHPIATTETLEAGRNYFPELPDSWFAPISIETCGVTISAEEMLAQQV